MTKSTKTVKATKAVSKTAVKTTKAKAVKTTPNLAKVTNQAAFLETYLRGTNRTLSQAQAAANYGIKNLAARMSEFRSAGLKVSTDINTTGKTVYAVSSRDVNGRRSRIFAA